MVIIVLRTNQLPLCKHTCFLCLNDALFAKAIVFAKKRYSLVIYWVYLVIIVYNWLCNSHIYIKDASPIPCPTPGPVHGPSPGPNDSGGPQTYRARAAPGPTAGAAGGRLALTAGAMPPLSKPQRPRPHRIWNCVAYITPLSNHVGIYF